MPILSIVIANRNYGRFISDAIKSVLGQGHEDFVELIVVDGLSTDNSVPIIKELAGEELSFDVVNDDKGKHEWHRCTNLTWISERDCGQSEAFNKGFAFAKGRFLTWLNADDILVKGAIAAFIQAYQKHPNIEWFSGSCIYADEKLRIKKFYRCHKFSRIRALFGRFSVGGPSSFFSKRIYEKVGRIDEGLHFCMDADLWWKFSRLLGLGYARIDHPIFVFRVHALSKVSGLDVKMNERNMVNRKKQMEEGERLRRRYGLYPKCISPIVNLLTFSFVDRVISIIRTFRYKGIDAREI